MISASVVPRQRDGEDARRVARARDTAKLERIAADLKARDPRSAVLAKPEFHDPAAIKAFADSTIAQGLVDVVLIAHGWMPLDQPKADIATADQILQVNAVSPVLFAEAFAGPFAAAVTSFLESAPVSQARTRSPSVAQ